METEDTVREAEDVVRGLGAMIERKGKPYVSFATAHPEEDTALCVVALLVPRDSREAFMSEWVAVTAEVWERHGLDRLVPAEKGATQ